MPLASSRTRLLGGLVALFLLALGTPRASAGQTPLPADVVRYLPNDCHFLIAARAQQFLQSGVWKGIQNDAENLRSIVEQLPKETGVSPQQVDYVVMADSGREKEASFWIVRLNKPVKGSELAATQKEAKFKESDIAGQKVYENQKKTEESFAVVDGKTILNGRVETIRAVLERGGAPHWDASFERMMREADFDRTLVIRGDSKFFSSDKSKKQTGGKVDEKYFKSLGGAIASARADDDLAVELTMVCKDAETAEDVRKVADGALVVLKYVLEDDKDIPKEVYDLIRQVKASSEGHNCRATVTVATTALAKLAQNINKDKDKNKDKTSKKKR
jgi:hypothetical protein